MGDSAACAGRWRACGHGYARPIRAHRPTRAVYKIGQTRQGHTTTCNMAERRRSTSTTRPRRAAEAEVICWLESEKLVADEDRRVASTSPLKRCRANCGSQRALSRHWKGHAGLLHGPYVAVGYRCGRCPKAFRMGSRARSDMAAHTNTPGCKGVHMIETWLSMFWFGQPGHKTLYGAYTDTREEKRTPYEDPIKQQHKAKSKATVDESEEEKEGGTDVEYFRQRLLEAEAAQNLQRDRRSSPRVVARVTQEAAGKVRGEKDAGRPPAEPQQ